MHTIFEDGESRSFFMRRFTFSVLEGQKVHICLPDMNLPNGFHE